MGTRWGINRTVAQIHAFLFLSEKPVTAETIAQTLGVARSNVSNSLRELQNWGIVKVVHLMGDRRDHFESMKDVWEMFRVIATERKKREIDPTLAVLHECIAEAGKSGTADRYTQERLSAMLEFAEPMAAWYVRVQRLSNRAIIKMIKLGDKAFRLLGVTEKIT